MADMEKREDQKISECLQSAFGYSDEQLLQQLDQVEKDFKNIAFDGAQERLMKRFMERKAEMEKETAAGEAKTDAQKESDETGETEEAAALEKRGKNGRKVVRIGKKKVLATVALVAVIGGMLGSTAVGRKNYFFKRSGGIESVYLDNADNRTENAHVKNVYDEIEETFDIPALRLGYSPEGMEYMDSDVYKEGAQIRFLYYDKAFYFIQRKRGVDTSSGINTDRASKRTAFNKWLNKKIDYYINELEDGDECEALITVNNNYYYLFGYIPKDEFKKILEYLHFA